MVKEKIVPLPDIADRQTWLDERRRLLIKEKELTRLQDECAAARRELPMVRLTEDYRFTGLDGAVSLLDLFGNHDQLIVQHFMFDPSWEDGCPSCTAMAQAGATPQIRHQLDRRGTAFAAVSRAPLRQLAAVRERRGWTFDWYSSFDSTFNLDFDVTLDPAAAPARFNFSDAAELADTDLARLLTYTGEQPGISCFLRNGDEVFHTYSTYARGGEVMMPAYRLLDLTAYGRQEPWEQPTGRPPELFRSDRGVLTEQKFPPA
ncbi:MAG: DUF899 domain-containing protein [Propionibacteriales bacterium]|nr:DUF899 domain-containing protein [Propionibacteriales bacterium]